MMLYPNERQKKMDRLRSTFQEYMNYDGRDILECTIREDAPEQVKKSFEQYKKLSLEEQKEKKKRLFM